MTSAPRRQTAFLALGAAAVGAVLALAALALLGDDTSPSPRSTATDDPVRITPLLPTPLSRVTLSSRAAIRLAIRTAPVELRPARAQGKPRKTVPYSAVIYDDSGDAWVYVNPSPLNYVRARVAIERIVDDTAILTSGPRVGTDVVTQGAAELFGAELGIDH